MSPSIGGLESGMKVACHLNPISLFDCLLIFDLT
jgi:hypothetical protein